MSRLVSALAVPLLAGLASASRAKTGVSTISRWRNALPPDIPVTSIS